MKLEVVTNLICTECGFQLCSYRGTVVSSDPIARARYKEHAKVCEGKNAKDWPKDIKQRIADSRGFAFF